MVCGAIVNTMKTAFNTGVLSDCTMCYNILNDLAQVVVKTSDGRMQA